MNESYYFFKIGVFCMFMIDNSFVDNKLYRIVYLYNFFIFCLFVFIVYFVEDVV